MNSVAQLLLYLLQNTSTVNTSNFPDNDTKNNSNSLIFASLLEAALNIDNSHISATQNDSALESDQVGKTENPFEKIIDYASEKYGVDQKLIREVISAESSFNPEAVSTAGAQGLMQLMPSTAASYGVTDPLNPIQNIDGGTHFLKDMLDRYKGNISLALAAYNAGPGAVKKYHGIPPYRETQAYVNKIVSRLDNIDTKV